MVNSKYKEEERLLLKKHQKGSQNRRKKIQGITTFQMCFLFEI